MCPTRVNTNKNISCLNVSARSPRSLTCVNFWTIHLTEDYAIVRVIAFDLRTDSEKEQDKGRHSEENEDGPGEKEDSDDDKKQIKKDKKKKKDKKGKKVQKKAASRGSARPRGTVLVSP